VYRDSGAVDKYVAALCRELSEPPDSADRSDIDTIYFGGGTPSLLTPRQVSKIFDTVNSVFSISVDAEITMEMNPATVTPAALTAYRGLGVNRASFGVQTFDDRDLKLLARGHNAQDARDTYRMLREAGFTNISLDLIAGLPGQTMANWRHNLDEAIALSPEHISLYLLEIHQGTPLAEQIRSGRRTPIDDDLAAEMYEIMLDRLAAAGYDQYEISNFSRLGYESRHNTKYWRLDPVYGFGVSAHSFDGRKRYSNQRDTAKYVEMIGSQNDARVETFTLSPKQLSGEYAFLNLRLTKGLDLAKYRELFDIDILLRYRDDLTDLTEAGLIRIDDGRLRLTRKGMLYSNEVFSIFI